MTHILITGGTGMTGLNTAREFARSGRRVVITTRQTNARVEKFIEDFRDQIIIEPVNLASSAQTYDLFSRYRFEGVIHAVGAHQAAQTRSANLANYDMLFNCLQAAEGSAVKRFVLLSSVAAFAGLAPPFSEEKRYPVQAIIDDSPDAFFVLNGPDGSRQLLVPRYEVCVKRTMEQIALDYATPMQMGMAAHPYPNQLFNQHQMEVAVLRLTTQFGPGYTHMGNPIALAIHTLAGKGNLMSGTGYANLPIPVLWNVAAQAPLLYVRDTASALVAMMQTRDLAHRVYHISSGYTTSPRAQFLALRGMRTNGASLMQLNPEMLREEPYPTTSFNGDLLAQDTGWKSGYSFEGAVEDYVRWLQDHQN
jgi:nucleoside-diphosphate-sugar epimerase